ncbi:Uncharacterised protein [Bordetella pertussis]|nr:Uncharacterised protein [Bordetella pertussis]
MIDVALTRRITSPSPAFGSGNAVSYCRTSGPP